VKKKSQIVFFGLFFNLCDPFSLCVKGPAGPKTLCNACGLRWAKQVRKVDEHTAGREGMTAVAMD